MIFWHKSAINHSKNGSSCKKKAEDNVIKIISDHRSSSSSLARLSKTISMQMNPRPRFFLVVTSFDEKFHPPKRIAH
jgi:hypothetical protein